MYRLRVLFNIKQASALLFWPHCPIVHVNFINFQDTQNWLSLTLRRSIITLRNRIVLTTYRKDIISYPNSNDTRYALSKWIQNNAMPQCPISKVKHNGTKQWHSMSKVKQKGMIRWYAMTKLIQNSTIRTAPVIAKIIYKMRNDMEAPPISVYDMHNGNKIRTGLKI